MSLTLEQLNSAQMLDSLHSEDSTSVPASSSERGRYLVKNLLTGKLDTETQWPVSKSHAENTPLIDGHEWVEVEVRFTEVGCLMKPVLMEKK